MELYGSRTLLKRPILLVSRLWKITSSELCRRRHVNIFYHPSVTGQPPEERPTMFGMDNRPWSSLPIEYNAKSHLESVKEFLKPFGYHIRKLAVYGGTPYKDTVVEILEAVHHIQELTVKKRFELKIENAADAVRLPCLKRLSVGRLSNYT